MNHRIQPESPLTPAEWRALADVSAYAARGVLVPAGPAAVIAEALRRLARDPPASCPDCDAKLAAVHAAVVEGFLGSYGRSDLPSFRAAKDLAESVRTILAGSGVSARERVAGAERERLAGEMESRRVTLLRPSGQSPVEAVLWAAARDLLGGMPTTRCGEIRP